MPCVRVAAGLHLHAPLDDDVAGLPRRVRDPRRTSPHRRARTCPPCFSLHARRYVSVPKYHMDKTKYLTPIGRLQFQQFANTENKNEWTTQTNYRDYDKGANALKIINQVEWEVRTTAHAVPTLCPPARTRRPCARRATAPQRTSVWRISAPTIPTRAIRASRRVKWPTRSRSRCTAASSTRKRRGTTFGA